MEIDSPIKNEPPEDPRAFELNRFTKSDLGTAARWAKVIAVFLFIVTGVAVLGLIGTLTSYYEISKYDDASFITFPGILFTGIYLAEIILLILCAFALLQFSSGIKKALAHNSNNFLSYGFLNLFKFFRLGTIMAIIFLAMWLLSFLF